MCSPSSKHDGAAQADTGTEVRLRSETDRQTNRQSVRQTGRQTDSQSDKQADRQTDRQTEAEAATSSRMLTVFLQLCSRVVKLDVVGEL